MQITYIQDPGHGWIAVPLSIIREWNIKPSQFSYRDETMGYLEEDCDASLFVNEAKSRNVSIQIIEQHTNQDSPIRRMRRF